MQARARVEGGALLPGQGGGASSTSTLREKRTRQTPSRCNETNTRTVSRRNEMSMRRNRPQDVQ
eukprot:scaffold911_cov314-Pavlova_lutheri.AAC.9